MILRKFFFRKSRAVYMGAVALTVLLNVAAWNSSAFADWYIAHIFPLWVGTYGRLTGLFPFSVGEWLLALGVLVLGAALALGVLWVATGVWLGFRRLRARRPGPMAVFWVSRPGKVRAGTVRTGAAGGGAVPAEEGIFWGFRRFSRGFYRFFVWTLLIVSLIMTLNCFILYHASTFSEHYFGAEDGVYGLEELLAVYNLVAGECNRLAGVIGRNETGRALYQGSRGRDGAALDMADMARELMRRLGEDYGQLDGYYPRPKALLSSDFMCQQYMQGYYFPFSMEANYNDVMEVLNVPATMCHELAHLRGYIYEDEANFIGYLACVESEDDFFRYAGYLSVLTYLYNDLSKARRESPMAYGEAVAEIPPLEVAPQVWADSTFVSQEEWDRINGKALLDTEVVDKAADVFIDTNLKLNGVADGAVSYSRVVRLLLQYYRYRPFVE